MEWPDRDEKKMHSEAIDQSLVVIANVISYDFSLLFFAASILSFVYLLSYSYT